MSRRQSRVLIAAAVWTLYVWISRIVIMSGQDESAGFKVVHLMLALVSIGFALAIAKIGWDARGGLRRRPAQLDRGSDPAAEAAGEAEAVAADWSDCKLG